MCSKHVKYGAGQATRPRPQTDNSLIPEILSEIRDRVRRIETRSTKYFEAQGFDTGSTRATWRGMQANEDAARIDLPTPGIALKDILAVIPKGFEGDVDLYVGEELIAMLYR